MSPTEYEYLFILDALERKEPIFPFIVTALKESGLVEVSEQGISLTSAGESLMQSISEDRHAHAPANDDCAPRTQQ
jgi:ribosomal protein S19E (S16A)